MLRTKIIQMKIIKMSIIVHLNLNKNSVLSAHLSTCCIQSSMLETGIWGMPIHLEY